MKLKNPLIYILAALTLSLVGTVAPAATINVLQTFDYPDSAGEVNATLPQKISDQHNLVGIVMFATGVEKAFIYKTGNGRFSEPFAEPNDTGHMTHGRGINNRRHVVGEYLDGSDGTFHGYKLLHPSIAEIDVTGALETIPLGINNAGDFVGTVILSDSTQPAFLSLGGSVTTFAVPDATATFAYQLNTANEIIGYYIDANGITHGYTRDGDGNLTFPIDVAGSTGTLLFGNNDSNWGVGRYTDVSGVTHGLYFITPDDIQCYDYPGATLTSLNGINKDGLICGYYVDGAGITHGLVAMLDLTPTPTPTPSPSPSPSPTPTPPAQSLNVSTRLDVGTGDKVSIGGIIITPGEAKRVLLRAIGPSLANFGITDPLPDPVLELHAGDGSRITSNDNWEDSQQAEIEATGLAPTNPLESAIIRTLDPGLYTAVVNGKDGGTGVGLVEAYDLDQSASSQLGNLSTRGFVDIGNNVMIGGFILGPDDALNANVLVRAIGPSLAAFGVTDALADPVLELHDANGALLVDNNDWKESQQAEIEATGLQPTNDLESAILMTLAPGGYTAVVAGSGGSTGVALVELYRLP